MLIQLRARALWPRLVLFSALIFGLSMAHAANREIEEIAVYEITA